MAILFLNKELRKHIYAIYGFVRFADEIVDSFHAYDKKELLSNYRSDANDAVRNRISLNPILNAFQATVHQWICTKGISPTMNTKSIFLAPPKQ